MKQEQFAKLKEAYCLIGEVIAYTQGVNDYAELQRSQFKLVYVNPNPPQADAKKNYKEAI